MRLPLSILILIISMVVSLPLLLPFFHPGYFPTHDGEWAVVRLTDMYREIKDLQIPARYSGNLNFGYGYPLFEFAYPLPYYLGFMIHLAHFNFVDSIKLLFALSVPLSFLAMFILSKKLWKNIWVAGISSLLYIYYPYRLVDLYVRGSIGESLALVLFPLIIYFIIRFHESQKVIYSGLAGLTFACLVMTHNIMAVEFLPICLLSIGISLWISEKERSKLGLGYLILLFFSFSISAFFWLPAMIEKGLIALSVIPIADRSLYFVQPWQLLFSGWEYGTNNFSHQLGILQIIVLISLFIVVWFKKYRVDEDRFSSSLAISMGTLCIAYIILLFSPTLFIWNNLPLFKEITYPWTLMAPIGFLISLLSGMVFNVISNKWLLGFVAVIAIIICIPLARPSGYVNRGDGFYLTNDATTTSSDEYMPLWVKEKPLSRASDKFILDSPSAKILASSFNSKQFSVNVESSRNLLLTINTIYYPGWQVSLNGKPATINYSNPRGLMTVALPPGNTLVIGKFAETPIRLFSDIVSLISILAFGVLVGLKLIKPKL